MKKLLASLLAVLTVFVMISPATIYAETTDSNKDFVLFDLDNYEEMPFKFEPYRGKALLISMFTTWCPYCIKEIPDFLQYQQDHSEDIQVLMVHVPSGEDFAVAEKYWKDKGYEELTLLSDKDSILASAFNVQGFPTNLIFDKDGKLHQYGYGLDYAALDQIMGKLGILPKTSK